MSNNHAGTRAIVAALTANVGIAITKAVAWVLTGSSSMLAEAVHSLADSGNQLLLLFGNRSARKAPDVDHQFGYGRARYLAAFVVSIVLFTLGGLFALFEAWEKYAHPEAIESWRWVPIAVLVVSILMEGLSFRTALVEANKLRGKKRLLSYVRSSRSPEIPLVLLEDLGALLGLCLALIGVSLTLVTGDGRWDAVGSGSIGVLLVVIAIFLALEMSSLLMGESVSPENQQKIAQVLPGGDLKSVVYLRTVHTGPDSAIVAVKMAVEPQVTGAEIADSIDAAEERIREAVALDLSIFIEPDLMRD